MMILEVVERQWPEDQILGRSDEELTNRMRAARPNLGRPRRLILEGTPFSRISIPSQSARPS
jgi:hypothetical protein